MNLIGIDISIDSTGISLYRGEELMLFNFTTMKKSVAWIKKMMEFVDFEFIDYMYKETDKYSYTEKEIMKLREFNNVTDIIVKKIISNIDKKEKTSICLEGYNFGRKGNSLIDIVSFSTLLRIKLLSIPNIEKIIVVSPMTLKSEAAALSYGFTFNKKGKRIINKNKNGLSGGSFDKRDMLEALMNTGGSDRLSLILNKYKDDILKLKSVPKPIDDLVDSFFLMSILKS